MAHVYAREMGLVTDHLAEKIWEYLKPLAREERLLEQQQQALADISDIANTSTVEFPGEGLKVSLEISLMINDCTKMPEVDIDRAYECTMGDSAKYRKLKLEVPLFRGFHHVREASTYNIERDCSLKRILTEVRRNWELHNPNWMQKQMAELKVWQDLLDRQFKNMENGSNFENIVTSTEVMAALHEWMATPAYEVRDQGCWSNVESTGILCALMQSEPDVMTLESFVHNRLEEINDNYGKEECEDRCRETTSHKVSAHSSEDKAKHCETSNDSDAANNYSALQQNLDERRSVIGARMLEKYFEKSRKGQTYSCRLATDKDSPTMQQNTCKRRKLEHNSEVDVAVEASTNQAANEKRTSTFSSNLSELDSKPDVLLRLSSGAIEGDESGDENECPSNLYHDLTNPNNKEAFYKPATTKLHVPKLKKVKVILQHQHQTNKEFLDQMLGGRLELPPEIAECSSMLNEGFSTLSEMDKVVTKSFHGSTAFLDAVTRRPDDIVDSKKLLWKKPGLRFLDCEETTNRDLEPGDLLSIPGIRETVISYDTKSQGKTIAVLRPDVSPLVSAKHNAKDEALDSKIPSLVNDSVLFQRPFNSFLDLRGKKFAKFKPRSGEIESEIPQDRVEQGQSSDERLSSFGICHNQPNTIIPMIPEQKLSRREDCSAPKPRSLERYRMIVVDNALIKANASLICFLERVGHEKLTIVSRDINGVEDAAPDLILNPNTCLIITHPQALSQVPLPGHKTCEGLPLVYDRVQRLSLEYEEVLVLIHCTPEESGAIQSRDHHETVRFAAFCSSLRRKAASSDSPIIPILVSVASGRSSGEAVSAWVWRLIEEHAFPTSNLVRRMPDVMRNIFLIHDETQWEIFLKRAGMNVFAAQVVLAALQQPKCQSRDTGQPLGLTDFVSMGIERRISMLNELIGHEAVIRVSKFLSRGNYTAFPRPNAMIGCSSRVARYRKE